MDSKIFVYRIDLFFKVFLKSFFHFIFVLSWKWKIGNFILKEETNAVVC